MQQRTTNPLAQGWEERWSDEQKRPYWTSAGGEATWIRPGDH
jgi:hypothetical protein